MVKFMPAEFKLTETRSAAEGSVRRMARARHLLRLLCSRLGFRVSVNRATSETCACRHAGRAGAAEGLVKSALDQVVQVYLKQPDSSSSGSATTRSTAGAGANAEHSGQRGDQDAREAGRIWGWLPKLDAEKSLRKFNPHQIVRTGNSRRRRRWRGVRCPAHANRVSGDYHDISCNTN